MIDIMIDIEALDIVPTATILTIGAQLFDPFGEGVYESDSAQFYCRVITDTQDGRTASDSTLTWWSDQPPEAQEEAFGEDGRIELVDALNGLSAMVRKANHIWANGPTYDMTILEHAYKQHGLAIPWSYSKVRDCRTVYSLYPDLSMPNTTHHALEDCWRQIALLQVALDQLNVKDIY